MSNTNHTDVPAFFSTVKIPTIAKWAMDKTKPHAPSTLDVQGRLVQVLSWYFEGKFPRPAGNEVNQFDCLESGKQYTVSVRTFGGVYRGQKPTVMVCFTEYSSEDGLALPV